jgi:hypothetical protein
MALDIIPPMHRANWRIHRVTNGETLADIARHYSMPLAAISTANQSMNALPEAGDLLIIPASYRAERATIQRAKTATHRKATHAGTQSHRRVAAGPRPSTRPSSYKTVSLAVKQQTTAN